MAGVPPAPAGAIATLGGFAPDVNGAGSVADRANRTKPGELLRLVAEGLAAYGFEVRPPEHEGGCRMVIGCKSVRCAVSVTDWGDVEWECLPQAGGETDPKQIADIATTLLTGPAQDYPRLGDGYGHDTVTFKGIVGLELKARGLDVGLEVYEDEDYFDARAEIVLTSPGSEDDAAVHVTDDGSITWTRDYWAQAATVAWGPDDCCGWIADPQKVAGDDGRAGDVPPRPGCPGRPVSGMVPAQQVPTPGGTVARINGTVPRLSVAAGRKGFKAELEELRERMRSLSLGHEPIAGEIARRYRLRPREAYRLAHGWTLGQAAAQFNARAAELGCDPDGLASLAGNRLCEYEKLPHSERRPSVYVLVMLARLYQTGVLNLLDLADHEHLPPRDRLTLLQPGQITPSAPGLSTPAESAAQATSHPSTASSGLEPVRPLASAQGMSLSLPYVPGRLVIEVTEPAQSTGPCGGETPQAVASLVARTPVPAIIAPARVSYSERA
jgi:hypothetical protein